MKRPKLILALAALQVVLSTVYLGVAAYLIYLTSKPEVMEAKDPSDAAKGLFIAAGVLGAFCFSTFISAIGLWFVAPWGRWLSVVLNGLVVAGLIYRMLVEPHADWELLGYIVALVATLVPFLLPVTGKAMANSQEPNTAE